MEEAGGGGRGRGSTRRGIWGWGEDDATETRGGGEKPGFVEEMSARWSDHYKANPGAARERVVGEGGGGSE